MKPLQSHKSLLLGTATIAALATLAFFMEAGPEEPPLNARAVAPQGADAQDERGAAPPKAAVNMAGTATTTAEQAGASDKTQPSVTGEARQRLAVMQQRRPERSFDARAVEAAMQRQDAWQAGDDDVASELPLDSQAVHDGRQLMRFDTLKLETLNPGDHLRVPIDKAGEAYDVVIDKVMKHDYDSISWYGHIEGNDGQRYNVSFTRGDSLTVGGLETPAGHFTMQAHGSAGWIAASSDLFKTPGETDAVLPGDVTARSPNDGSDSG